MRSIVLLPLLALAACAAPLPTDATETGTEPAPAPAPAPEPPTDAEVAELAAEQTRFGLGIYASLRKDGGNLFFSPLSMAAALSMTYAGAAGETAEEIRDALAPGMEPDRVHAAFGRLLESLRPGDGDGYALAVANALWTQEGKPFRQPFLDTLERDYRSELQLADFAADPEAERARVNAWVSDHTSGRIRDLFPPSSILPTTRLVLANAVTFLGTWRRTFEKRLTREDDFHYADGTTARVPVMTQIATFAHTSQDDVQLAEFPYIGNRLAMVVILPRRHDGLAAIEAQLTPEWLAQRVAELRMERLRVRLPKFVVSAETGFSGALRALGVRTAFTRGADFSAMDGTHDLYLQAAQHKAFVRVDERGTEAAAASGMVLGVKSVPREFDATRPFVFLIRDRATGTLLFLGRLVQPKSRESPAGD